MPPKAPRSGGCTSAASNTALSSRGVNQSMATSSSSVPPPFKRRIIGNGAPGAKKPTAVAAPSVPLDAINSLLLTTDPHASDGASEEANRRVFKPYPERRRQPQQPPSPHPDEVKEAEALAELAALRESLQALQQPSMNLSEQLLVIQLETAADVAAAEAEAANAQQERQTEVDDQRSSLKGLREIFDSLVVDRDKAVATAEAENEALDAIKFECQEKMAANQATQEEHAALQRAERDALQECAASTARVEVLNEERKRRVTDIASLTVEAERAEGAEAHAKAEYDGRYGALTELERKIEALKAQQKAAFER